MNEYCDEKNMHCLLLKKGAYLESIHIRSRNYFSSLFKILSPKYLYLFFWCLLRHWHPTPVLLPGKSHGWRSLESCSPWGRWGLDTAERLHFHFSLLCIGEGNGSPLRCSCLENPRDGASWWAAVYGVAQSRTWLKWLSSCSKAYMCNLFLKYNVCNF